MSLNVFQKSTHAFKCDLAKENLANNQEQMNEFCRDKGFAGWFETSAKDDINVEQAAKFLVSKVCDLCFRFRVNIKL